MNTRRAKRRSLQSRIDSWRRLERVMGIEPTWPAWKAGTLPLSYTRLKVSKLLRRGPGLSILLSGPASRECRARREFFVDYKWPVDRPCERSGRERGFADSRWE